MRPLVVAAGAEPEDVVVANVDEHPEQRAAGLSSRPAPAAQCRRIVVLGGLRDDLRPVVEKPLRPRRQRHHLAIRRQETPQIDASGGDDSRSVNGGAVPGLYPRGERRAPRV